MTSRKKKSGTRSFEDAVRRLEEIVDALEQGTVSLEDALALYEEGITLVRMLWPGGYEAPEAAGQHLAGSSKLPRFDPVRISGLF